MSGNSNYNSKNDDTQPSSLLTMEAMEFSGNRICYGRSNIIYVQMQWPTFGSDWASCILEMNRTSACCADDFPA